MVARAYIRRSAVAHACSLSNAKQALRLVTFGASLTKCFAFLPSYRRNVLRFVPIFEIKISHTHGSSLLFRKKPRLLRLCAYKCAHIRLRATTTFSRLLTFKATYTPRLFMNLNLFPLSIMYRRGDSRISRFVFRTPNGQFVNCPYK